MLTRLAYVHGRRGLMECIPIVFTRCPAAVDHEIIVVVGQSLFVEGGATIEPLALIKARSVAAYAAARRST